MSARKSAPAALRNRGPIADTLAGELPETGLVLEIASGTGEHVLEFARRFSSLVWQPTDPDETALASIAAWREHERRANLLAPVQLDAAERRWPVDRADAVICINMVHISPWAASQGLFAGAKRILRKGAPIALYGPYLEDGVETAPSNIDFDASLKQRNPEWGLRRIEEVDALAARNGFTRTRRVEMPANNLTVVYRKG